MRCSCEALALFVLFGWSSMAGAQDAGRWERPPRAARPGGYWDDQSKAASGRARLSALEQPALLNGLTEEPGQDVQIGPSDVPLAPPTEDSLDLEPPLPAVDAQQPGGEFSGLGISPVVPYRWFVGGAGLIFQREGDDDLFLGYDDAAPGSNIFDMNDTSAGTFGGFQVWIGRYLSDSWAVEALYWGLFPADQQQDLFASTLTGNLTSTFTFTGLDYDNGAGAAPVGNFFTATQMLRARRDYNYHNVEINFLHNTCPFPNPCCRGQFVWLAGARYLQIDEGFCLASDFTSEAFGDDPANELFYNINVENRLVGFQLGGIWDHCVSRRVALRVASKAGIFGNDIDYSQRLHNGTGVNATVNTGPYSGQDYDVTADKNDVSFVGELFAGASYQGGAHWRALAGYRAVFATGIATPSGQIPQNFSDLAAISRINSNDSIVLHGVILGGEFVW